MSLIVPVFNSESSLHRFFENVAEFANSSDCSVEIVFVDDGSTDGSVEILRDLQRQAPNVVIVEHPLNRGQPKATLAGILAAEHDVVVTLDDDLQYRPQDIPILLGALAGAERFTLVMGIPASIKRPLWRALAGMCGNFVSNLFLARPLPLRLTTFCAFHRRLCANLDPDADRDIALITELVQASHRVLTVPVQPGVSVRAASRYNLTALVRLFMSRSSSYSLSRVLLWLSCSLFLMAGSAALLLTSGAVAYLVTGLVFAAASLMLGLLAIKLRRRSRTDHKRINPSG